MGGKAGTPTIIVRSLGTDKIIIKDRVIDYTLTLNLKTIPDLVLYFNCKKTKALPTQMEKNYTQY